MRYVYLLLPLLFALPLLMLIASCVTAQHSTVVPLDDIEQFNICNPLRGEAQPFDLRRHGHGYDSVQHFCI